jgi:hypothetical protein
LGGQTARNAEPVDPAGKSWLFLRQKWQPIATAPANAALELSIYDKGE